MNVNGQPLGKDALAEAIVERWLEATAFAYGLALLQDLPAHLAIALKPARHLVPSGLLKLLHVTRLEQDVGWCHATAMREHPIDAQQGDQVLCQDLIGRKSTAVVGSPQRVAGLGHCHVWTAPFLQRQI